MIQESINQMLGTAALAGRLSHYYEDSQAAKNAYTKGIAAETGLKDISGVLDRASAPGGTPLSQYELRDIEGRVGEHVHNIGSLKTAAIPGQSTAKYIPTELDATTRKTRIKGMAPREEYSKRLDSIAGKINAMKEKAMQSMTGKGQAAIMQDQQFQDLRDDVINHRKKRILEMKNTSARNQNREQALESILPKGGSRPLVESEGFNPESKIALQKMEEKKAASTEQKQEVQGLKDVVEGKVEEPEVFKTDVKNDPLFKGVELSEKGSLENKGKVGTTQIFTRQQEIDKMIRSIGEDVIKDVERTILEPSGGEGAFTSNILARRMRGALEDTTNPKEFLKKIARGLTTIYTIEPMGDTVAKHRSNLRKILDNALSEFEKKNNITIDKNSSEYKKWKIFTDDVLKKNIIHGYHGDTLREIAKSKGKAFTKAYDQNILGYQANKNSDIDYDKPIQIYDFIDDDYFKED